MMDKPLVVVALLTFFVPCSDAQDIKPITTNKIRGNHHVQLVAASYSESRGQNLVAEFKATDLKAEPKKIFVKFPAHSFTPHEETIIAIIRSSVKWDSRKKTKHERNEAIVRPMFSIPKKPKSNDFSKRYLLRIEQPD